MSPGQRRPRTANTASSRTAPRGSSTSKTNTDHSAPETAHVTDAVTDQTDGLRVAPDLVLPASWLTHTSAILAMRGAGKSNVGVVLAEEFTRLDLPWVAVDAKGDWWGIRSSFDGQSPGLPAVVLGGDHGDVPLPPTAGEAVARLIVNEDLTCVLDVSEFSKRETTRFLTAFFDTLYRQNSSPRHIFLEEADEYIPQRVMADQAVLLGSVERLVKRGRFKGLGFTALTQRSASLNKNVLSQVDSLIAMRTTSPNDRKAIDGWVRDFDLGKEMIASLPSLGSGQGWISSPQWLPSQGGQALQQVTFRRRSTYDAGRTPDLTELRNRRTASPTSPDQSPGKSSDRTPTRPAGARGRSGVRGGSLSRGGVPRVFDVDVDVVRTALKDALEVVEAQNPEVLREELQRARADLRSVRRELQDVRGKLARAQKAVEASETVAAAAAADQVAGAAAEVEREAQAKADRTDQALSRAHELLGVLEVLLGAARDAARQRLAAEQNAAEHQLGEVADLGRVLQGLREGLRSDLGGAHVPGSGPGDRPGDSAAASGVARGSRGSKVGAVERRSRRPSAGALREPVVDSTAPGSTRSATSGLARDRASSGTDSTLAVPVTASATGQALPKAQRAILAALAPYAPRSRTKGQVALMTGYSGRGGGFNNALSALRTAGRISGGPDSLTVTAAGLQAIGDVEPLPSGQALISHWAEQLPKAPRLILLALSAQFPATMSKEDVAAACDYEPSGGGFNNALSRLRTLGLITGRGDALTLHPDLVDP